MSSSSTPSDKPTPYKPTPVTMEDIRQGMTEYFIRDGKNYASIYGKEKMLLVYSEFLCNQKNFNLSQDDLKFIFTNLVRI